MIKYEFRVFPVAMESKDNSIDFGVFLEDIMG